MGRVLLVLRLAARNVRRRPAEAGLLVLAMMAATTTLTLGFVLRGVTDDPYDRTRDATAGPDVVASVGPVPSPEDSPSPTSDGWLQMEGVPADLAALEALADDPRVVDHTGPYPLIEMELDADGTEVMAWVQGRDPDDADDAPVDQPELTEGSWVEDGGVVVEAGFADALGVGEGDQITLGGNPVRVAGVAVTAAVRPFPDVCFGFCAKFIDVPGDDDFFVIEPDELPDGPFVTIEVTENPFLIGEPGLVWLTEADVRALVPAETSLTYAMNLKLADPADAQTFADEHISTTEGAPFVDPWQSIRKGHGKILEGSQQALRAGSSLLALLAIASIAVLIGGRMADQTRRVGLLKAVGGTPRLVAMVLLAEYVALALLAAAAGLAAGWLATPWLADPGASLLGRAGAPSLTPSTVVIVTTVALGIAVAATLVPTLRAARTSTVHALANAARPPRRIRWLLAISARLPVSLLLGLRVVARRPRRVVLSLVSITISVSGIVAALAVHATLEADAADVGGGIDPVAEQATQVLLLITVMLVTLAAVNAIVGTWATVLDSRHTSALARALGATPRQVSTGLSAAQVLPALVGAVLGIAGGLALHGLLSNDEAAKPPLWQLLTVVPMTVLVVAALTAVPARLGARRPTAEVLQSELA